jgi:hypothetical protein
MLNHVVLMKFKPDVSDADIDNLEQALDNLPNVIVEIQMYEFGRDILRTERSYDFALVSLFSNQQALQRYQQHPAHVEVGSRLKALCEEIVTVDFFGTDAGDLKSKTPLESLIGDDK